MSFRAQIETSIWSGAKVTTVLIGIVLWFGFWASVVREQSFDGNLPKTAAAVLIILGSVLAVGWWGYTRFYAEA